jgi:alkylhydroperoxidase/carboxymuconolactone decarboxylase family protein YurZ
VFDYKTTLRKLAVRDDRYVGALLADEEAGAAESGLEPRVRALVQIGALVAVDAAPPSYMGVVEEAFAAGATPEDIVGSLVVVLPVVGVPRVVSAAPNLGLALGYDVADALEVGEDDGDTAGSRRNGTA